MTTPDTISIDMAIAERRLAEVSVVSDIECNALGVKGIWPRMYDVRNLLDMREQPAQFADMFREALAYAEWRGLIRVLERTTAGEPAVVRILRDAA